MLFRLCGKPALALEVRGVQFLEAGGASYGPGVSLRGSMFKPSVLASCALFAFPAFAESLTGNELLSVCEATDNQAQLGYCVGYVSGVIEGMKWGIASPLLRAGAATDEVEKLSNSLLGFCIPAEATLGQMRDVIMIYLRSNPADRHASARIHVQIALSEAYPCAEE